MLLILIILQIMIILHLLIHRYINCTDSENDIDIIIPALLFTIPCGLSFLCLISLMVYTLIKPLINKK